MRVVIAGGGIAGLETVLALQELAGERVELTLAAPEADFTYKPLLVEEPFSTTQAERLALAPLVESVGGHFVQQALAVVRPEDRVVRLADGSELGYDALVVCVGARERSAFRDAATFRATGERLPIDDLLRAAAEHSSRRISFVVPPGATWPLPIYEVALMAKRRSAALGLDLEYEVVTPEEGPLIMFGPQASGAVASLLGGRGISVRAAVRADETDDGGIVLIPGHDRLETGQIVALPVLEGRRIDGIPTDPDGFIPIDEHARVRGLDDVYAAGDGTNFPIKQGGLGTQQADAAAEHIAARAGAELEPTPFHPVLRGKVLTGDDSLSLRADVGGGGGEGVASDDYLWWPPHKVAGRFLAAWLAGETPHDDLEPPSRPIDVEVSLPSEWHREPMALDPYGPLGVD